MTHRIDFDAARERLQCISDNPDTLNSLMRVRKADKSVGIALGARPTFRAERRQCGGLPTYKCPWPNSRYVPGTDIALTKGLADDVRRHDGGQREEARDLPLRK